MLRFIPRNTLSQLTVYNSVFFFNYVPYIKYFITLSKLKDIVSF